MSASPTVKALCVSILEESSMLREKVRKMERLPIRRQCDLTELFDCWLSEAVLFLDPAALSLGASSTTASLPSAVDEDGRKRPQGTHIFLMRQDSHLLVDVIDDCKWSLRPFSIVDSKYIEKHFSLQDLEKVLGKLRRIRTDLNDWQLANGSSWPVQWCKDHLANGASKTSEKTTA